MKNKLIEEIRVLTGNESGKIKIDILPICEYQKLIEEAGGSFDIDEMDTNGWEVDFWINFKLFESSFTLSGSLFYGNYEITKE